MDKFYLPDDPNYKQHINIETETWECLENDMFVFTNMNSKMSRNGFLNQIILNSCVLGKFSISFSIDSYSMLLDSMIRGDDLLSQASNEAISRFKEILIQNRIEDLKKELFTKKGKQLQLKLHKKVKEILKRSNDSEYYECDVGLYIRHIFKQYAKLSNIQREQLFFLDVYEKLVEAIRYSYVVAIHLQNRSETFIPYCIEPDNHKMYNYVAGYVVNSDISDSSHSGMKTTSYRLSNIVEVLCSTTRKYKLTNFEMNNIRDEIKQNEIQYLAGSLDRIVLQLTEEGIRKYKLIIHQRPRYTSVDNSGQLFEFHSTHRQILNYFFKFGHDVAIVEPVELKNKFKELYEKALNKYID